MPPSTNLNTKGYLMKTTGEGISIVVTPDDAPGSTRYQWKIIQGSGTVDAGLGNDEGHALACAYEAYFGPIASNVVPPIPVDKDFNPDTAAYQEEFSEGGDEDGDVENGEDEVGEDEIEIDDETPATDLPPAGRPLAPPAEPDTSDDEDPAAAAA